MQSRREGGSGQSARADVKLGFAVRSVCRKYFGIDAEYLGYINHDPTVRRSVMARKPVVEFQRNSDASLYIERIARKLAQMRENVLTAEGRS